MRKRRLLPLFTLLWAASGCINGGFRHYEPISNYLPSVKSQHFVGPLKEILEFSDPAIEELVCFKIPDFTKHEKECHAK